MFLGDPVTGTHVYGAEEDFAGLDLTGKVVLISRGGGVSFFEKANRAVEAGAIATVVYNNAAGSLNMNMSGYNYKNPAIMLDKAYGDMILAASRQGEDGLWSGKMVIANQVQTVQDAPGGYLPGQLFLLGCSRQSGPEARDHRPRWQHLVHPEQWDLSQHVRYLHVCPQRYRYGGGGGPVR